MEKPGEMILSVVDDGPGIPNTLREWVIKPFNSTTPSGTGLGLSTVSRIAQAGGGQVEIEDSDLGGAKVSVHLPLTDVRPEQDRLPNLPQTDVPSMKILVVEDDELVRAILLEMLVSLGHHTYPVHDGLSALECLESHHDIDIVISDFRMPGLTGAELVERMRASQDKRSVIILSGYGSAIADQFSTPPDAILGKPLSPPDLRKVLAEVCQEKLSGVA